MVWRILISVTEAIILYNDTGLKKAKHRYLANNEKLIQMLADSYPMRKVARFAAGLIVRTKLYQERALESLKKVKDSSSIKETYKNESSDKFTQFMQDKVEKLKKILEDQKRQR